MSPKFFSLVLGIFLVATTDFIEQGFADTDTNQKIRQLVSLVDYIHRDYQFGIVPEGGKVISELEYGEMTRFSKHSLELAQEAGLMENEELSASLKMLRFLIMRKAEVDRVARRALNLRKQILEHTGIDTAPPNVPNYARGKKIYESFCAECHGPKGYANVPGADGLNPPPTKFAERAMMETLSPFQAVNTIQFGISGTSMRSYVELTESKVWDVAYYLFTLASESEQKASESADFAYSKKYSWDKLANKNNSELRAQIYDDGIDNEQRVDFVMDRLRNAYRHDSKSKDGQSWYVPVLDWFKSII